MTTRKAKDNSVLNQGRFASSPEFERGLLANLVAKRVALLDGKQDKELIWAVHFLSHQEGGLAAFARNLPAKFPHRVGTAAMQAIGKGEGKNYSADEIRQIRLDMPAHLRRKFPLKGETVSDLARLLGEPGNLKRAAEIAAVRMRAAENHFMEAASYEEIVTGRREERDAAERSEAARNPSSYAVTQLREFCRLAASEGIEAIHSDDPSTHGLERELAEMCLDPKWDLETDAPWYFADLIPVLREYIDCWASEKTAWPVTQLGKIIADEFDYTWESRCMSLLTGESRRGKSHAAKMCCLKYPGRARFVEVPPGNDDTSFFRTLARGLGLGNLGQYSTTDVRDRVETVLLSGDLILVLDESQRLFPERTRYAYPSRITWLMTMANAKVPILLISTPQFTDRQRLAEKGGWNSAQLTGRIFNYRQLPSDLDDADLMAVCRAFLPEASHQVLSVLSAYARTSARYLSAIESIAMRARYLASRAGRVECSTGDVRSAMKESVIPSDTRLNAVLEKARGGSQRHFRPNPSPQTLDEVATPEHNRMACETQLTPARRENLTEFVTA